MNKWEEFLKGYKIGSIYNQASFDNETGMNAKIKKGGESWCKEPIKSLLLMGDTGIGKTYFMCCLLRRLLQRGFQYQLTWKKSREIDERILKDFNQYGSASYYMNELKNIEFLFVDDFGCERSTERVERDYEEIIDERLTHQMATVISTNLNEKKIQEKFGDRTLSRLKPYSWIHFTGKDRRA